MATAQAGIRDLREQMRGQRRGQEGDSTVHTHKPFAYDSHWDRRHHLATWKSLQGVVTFSVGLLGPVGGLLGAAGQLPSPGDK